ncbi:MAG: dTDP-glucose 4,6-dehydratase [Planctomycetota bacterium]
MSDRRLQRVLVTGGAGFIGSNFIAYLLEQPDFAGRVVNVDALTYAGCIESVVHLAGNERYTFEHVDIRDRTALERVFREHDVDTVVHLAAESHVDRSIEAPADFITTNIVGTFQLLETAREAWRGRSDVLFHHVSTDEVFGSLGPEGRFTESSPYDPRSPYSASKASADHLVRAYGHTYGLPVTLSNCSNNYGPFQHPEKFIPVVILALLEGKPIPVYGDGLNVRDWLHVRDHASALWTVLCGSPVGETWNVGGNNERTNMEVVHLLCELVAQRRGTPVEALRELIRHVPDRPGHDRRYAIDGSKLAARLGWSPAIGFREGLEATVDWYLGNAAWIEDIRSGAYRDASRHGAT